MFQRIPVARPALLMLICTQSLWLTAQPVADEERFAPPHFLKDAETDRAVRAKEGDFQVRVQTPLIDKYLEGCLVHVRPFAAENEPEIFITDTATSRVIALAGFWETQVKLQYEGKMLENDPMARLLVSKRLFLRNAEEAGEIVKLIEELLHAAPTLRLQFLRYEDYTLYANAPFTYAFDPFSSRMLADGKGWRYEAAEETHGWHVQLSYGGYSSSFLRPDYQITTASNDRLVGLRRWITDDREWNLRQGPKVSGGIRQ